MDIIEEALLEADKIIRAMDRWNEDVEKIIGKVPNTGFERAKDVLGIIEEALKERRKNG